MLYYQLIVRDHDKSLVDLLADNGIEVVDWYLESTDFSTIEEANT